MPVYYLTKPGQAQPYNWFPYAALAVVVVAVIYSIVASRGRLGRLEAGYEFDAILLDDDPADMRTFTGRASVTGVFQREVAVVPHPGLEPSPR